MLIRILNTVLRIKTAKPYIKKSDFHNGVAFFVCINVDFFLEAL
ncbi:hypothetical protein KCTC52924_01627 [Arenibacter antarcticus]